MCRAVQELYFRDAHARQLCQLAAPWATVWYGSLGGHLMACTWQCPTTFTSFYVTDLSVIRDRLYALGPVVVAQAVVTVSSLR